MQRRQLRIPPSNGSCTPSASVTADAVYALALIGEDPAGAAWTVGGKSALDALAKLAPSYVYADAGQAGKVARAVALAGGDPRDFGGLNLIATIDTAYDPATGRYQPDFLSDTLLAVEALLRAGEPVPAAALDAVLTAQLTRWRLVLELHRHPKRRRYHRPRHAAAAGLLV